MEVKQRFEGWCKVCVNVAFAAESIQTSLLKEPQGRAEITYVL